MQITDNGTGDCMDSIVIRTSTFEVTAAVHYDEALADHGRCNPSASPNWRGPRTAAVLADYLGNFQDGPVNRPYQS